MRLHHLSISAFGPFAGTEEIDFDELNAAGLFLLTGPTGAGKTSVLDAICFGLYGSVPGARGVKTLKSQHAGPEARPEVVLDFSIQDRRLRVRRSPEWTRPKLRGTGTKAEPASATLVELGDDGETFLSSRAQEVGHLISGLIGMSASQFAQVAMLPQGEFATFLRATSQERHDVLQQLFSTDRFGRIETWVQEHSKDLEKRSGVEQREVQRILDTMADRAGVTLADDLDTDLPAAASNGRVLEWARTQVEGVTALLTRAIEHRAATRATVERARAEHTVAKGRCETARRRSEAEDVLARLTEETVAAQAASRAIRDADRAGRCRAMVAQVDEAAESHDLARTARDEHQVHLTRLQQTNPEDHAEVTSAWLSEQVAATRSTLARVDTLLPRERARQEARDVLATATEKDATLAVRVARARARLQQLPAERDALRQRLDEATATSHQRERFGAELDTARSTLAAARALPPLKAELDRADDALRAATDEAQTSREVMQYLIERRLSGMASELAGSLATGMPCQVCGSVEHPDPAAPSADAVTEQAQERATAVYDAASAHREEATQRATSAEKQLATMEQAADGLEEEEAAVREQELAHRLAEAVAATAEVDRLQQRLTQVEAELDQITQDLRTDEGELALQQQLCRNARDVVASVNAEISHVFPGAVVDRSLADLQEEHTSLLTAAEDALRASTSFEESSRRLAEQTSRAMATIEEEGFTSLDAVRTSALTDEQRAQHRSFLDQRERLRARAQGVLDELADSATHDVTADDLAALQTALEDALHNDETAARDLHGQEAVTSSLVANLTRLDQTVSSWAPVRDEHLRAEAMSKLVRGMGGDNHLQVRLSAYVLATRLDQVVAAANERLAQMRDQRYLLERTGRATRRGAQSGLGLDIIDEWTGDVRDPATLSGGETFVVSLSLALGLADVVSNEAGGTEMETLFVDEGFGTLDPDTLDDVMDRIDGLRDGGRTVGLVSHVGELRNRIAVQLHVDKRRHGSTVSLRTMVG